ncbi:helix-turn-helix domain-containing protein [Streptomyces sp. NA04227]|uniref:helix-turn-helix domain-containing protein n=1 Tax=Streptomyces sp. NA04227 TaxID=2742136 RepID=UPI0015928AAF|nr:helix-turn-helix domain-containing protein [Streptomyces sp. NA04227]QKW09730.1 helix-turn-helix domain-containing protein [Streptomyces sp. NA04227]
MNVVWHGKVDEEITVKDGELFIDSSARSVSAFVDTNAPECNLSVVKVPRDLMALPPSRLDRASELNLSVHSVYSGLLAQLLEQLDNGASSYRNADGPRLSQIAVDLLTAHVAHVADAEEVLPAETRQRELLVRCKVFIEQHLRDPLLTPSAVAKSQHISLRYLYLIFRQDEMTVAAWIRRRRLEGARRELSDPAMNSLRIHEIAGRWCFSGPSDFTRAFKSAFGTNPAEFRQLRQGHRH